MLFKRLRSILLPLAVSLPLSALAGPFSSLVVFGDSLSDHRQASHDGQHRARARTRDPAMVWARPSLAVRCELCIFLS